ncbi:hypothetical protein L1049_001084 [Liquidambar formosana]|uniref:Uncharacterized protein n=1 Tax=Liquidambar formosana TaxID=63359 RepID=A0AAP0N9Z0_LIQFO
MGRQSRDPRVTHSSIALLQERFRQLQRAKEMREERDVLRLSSQLERVNATTQYEPTRLFFHSELILPPRPPVQGSLYFQPNTHSKRTGLQVTETPILANLGSTEAVMHRTNVFDDSDVDTSLHL